MWMFNAVVKSGLLLDTECILQKEKLLWRQKHHICISHDIMQICGENGKNTNMFIWFVSFRL